MKRKEKREIEKSFTRPQVSDGVGDAAPFDLLDDGGQAAVVDSLATYDLEAKNGGR